MTLAVEVDEAEVLAALDRVVDPELDESIVQLGFVEDVDIDQRLAKVIVHLRLPTFWCSPNFAYLMAHDARKASLQVPGVRQVQIVLDDHGQSDEISEGVSAGRDFSEIFSGETDGDMDELRDVFRGKAFGMRQEQLVRFLIDVGVSPQAIVGLRVGDVEQLPRGAAPLAQSYLERRKRVGLGDDDDAWLITRSDGTRIAADGLEAHLQSTRRQRVSMTFNAMMCRGLLETRYGLTREERREAR